jgi:DNA-binding MarR family transcriptional regulator
MSVSTIQKLVKTLEIAQEVLGPDATLRQLESFLIVGTSGTAGIDGGTVERRTRSSQAATSRALKYLGPGLGLLEFFLDQNDGRRRLARLTKQGERLLSKLVDR